MTAFSLARLSANEARALLPQLHELLRDAVDARASAAERLTIETSMTE